MKTQTLSTIRAYRRSDWSAASTVALSWWYSINQHETHMDEAPQYYQAPERHKDHFRSMYYWLIGFFGSLGLLALIFIIFASSIAQRMPFSLEKRFVKPYEVMANRWLSDAIGDSEICLLYTSDAADD